MKRIPVILLLLALAFTACAEEDADFTFREGIAWGMSREEVLAVEGASRFDSDEDGVYTLEFDDIEQNGVRCDVEYAFMDDALFMASFEYDTEDVPVTYDALLASLTESYGAPGEMNDDIKALLDDDDLEELDAISGWVLENGTRAWLMYDSDDESIEIIFADLGW